MTSSTKNMPKVVLNGLKNSGIPVNDNYQDEYTSRESKLRAIFDEQMDAENSGVACRKVHVLLLSWHPDDDDLLVEKGVILSYVDSRIQPMCIRSRI